MLTVLAGLVVLLAGGGAALAASRRPRLCSLLGAGSAVAGSLVALWPAVRVLWTGRGLAASWDWQVPYGKFSIALDNLSAWFAMPILLLSGIAAIYGYGYMDAYREKRALGPPWFFYNALVASMLLVVVSQNAILFLVAWECMALTSFFLVTFAHQEPSVRRAGSIYFIAMHLGTAFLLPFFILLGQQAGSLDFAAFDAAGSPGSATANLLFLLALVGFGTKAGLMPFHVWLPEAHPAAPSHVSAVMSGVMIKTGIYGLFRTFTFLDEPSAWWPWVLIGLGAASAVGGILFALVQHDLKRLLAYSSVENVGVIVLGLGTGLLGLTSGQPVLAMLGLAGSLLHVFNHSLFKGLLFLSAGSVQHATGTRDINRLGGLAKRMPGEAACFVLGAVAIAALPPLNGFMGEYLIYLGAFREEMYLGAVFAVPALMVIAGLALAGGLAVVCFTKALGITFLGSPRSQQASAAHPGGWLLLGPQMALAAGCVAAAAGAPALVGRLSPSLEDLVSGLDGLQVSAALATATAPLKTVLGISALLVCLAAALAVVRAVLLSKRDVTAAETWGCGFVRPTARLQYTASSYVQPVADLLGSYLRSRRAVVPPAGYFPESASLTTDTPDPCQKAIYSPAQRMLERLLFSLRWLQHGRVHLYVLYIAVTLVLLLVWTLGFNHG